MKGKTFFPFLTIAVLILVVGLACGVATPASPTQVPPTQAPPPTIEILPTEVPVEITAEAPAYFSEEFESEIPNWTYFVQHGDESQMDLYTDNGRVIFDLEGEGIYAYLMYDPYVYTDVRIDALAENRGFNNNEVSLVCRYDPDYGWYEFAIANNGLYKIWAFDALTDDYHILFDGGSTAIRSGKDVNEYTVICQGDTLSLFINGVEARTLTETRYAFREGQVGISTSSFDVLPIIVEWDWVTISEP